MSQDRYLELVNRLFPKLKKRDGDPEGELKDAEKRLGLTLPAALREMYRLAGRRHDLHAAHDRLVLPKNLIKVHGALVFYEEHERLSAWGIPLTEIELEDPPVVSARNEPPFEWKRDHDKVSQFFVTELLWTHVNTEPHQTLDATPEMLAHVRERLEEIPLEGCHWGIDCYGKGGTVAIVRGDQILIGATSHDELDAFLA